MTMGGKRKIIIDTDAGIDDAQAILMALKDDNIEIIAITTCHGNTDVDNVTKNVCRVLQVAKSYRIPVYKGCDKSLMGIRVDSTHYHGKDGLGDTADDVPTDVSNIESQHAVNALIELSKQHQDLCLVCLAPLTNVAMAIRMDPGFSTRFKECFIMGGSYKAKGNVTANAEFNFYADPEAADIVLREMNSQEWYDDFVGGSSDKQKFMKRIERQTLEKFYGNQPSYITADQIAMAVALDKSVASKKARAKCLVEVNAGNTRGQLCVDWSGEHFKHENKIDIITELDMEKYSELLKNALK